MIIAADCQLEILIILVQIISCDANYRYCIVFERHVHLSTDLLL